MGNSLKNNSTKSQKSEEKFKPEPIDRVSTSKSPHNKDVKNKRIVGLVVFLLAMFLLTCMFSYINTWQQDQSALLKSSGIWSYLTSKTTDAKNAAGPLGAITAHNLIFNGFGIVSLLILPLLFGIIINLVQTSFKFKIWRYIKNAGLIALVGSPLLSFIAHNSDFSYGGAFGNLVVDSISQVGGRLGAGFILFGTVLGCIIYIFNPILKSPNMAWLRNMLRPTVAINNDEAIKQVGASDTAFGAIDNHDYENKEAELYVDEAVQKQNSLKEEVLQEEVEEDEFDDTPLELVTHNLQQEEEASYPAKEEHENGAQALDLELNNTVQVTPIKDNLRTDVDFEVVQIEETESVKDEHAVVANTDEPYDPSAELSRYNFPTIDLLDDRGQEKVSVSAEELDANKNQIIQTLKNFGISISKISATVGPTVTLYEIVPAEGVRISKIRNLEDDIALSLAALGIRIIAPIPGKGTIGIEVPNIKKQTVSMRTIIASEKFANSTAQLPIALGKKIDNDNYIGDLATMPHLLMAGATGQGKSVGLNAILVSLLYKKHPSQLKFVLVDPKKVELNIYKTIEKHFLAKLPNEEEAIITDTKKVINTLNSLCIEMDQRYDLLKDAAVRNIKEYNDKFVKRRLNPQKGHRYMPFIVLVVDEFADLMMTAGKEVEMPIARLAQLARAIGIHLIIATQRPSVNVITGTIKANFPARIAFRVSAKVDSRTILDAGGAEQLIGRGDMLVSTGNELVRLQCAFVDTPEVERIAEFIGEQQGYPTAYDLPEYVGADEDMQVGGKVVGELDQMFEQCARLVVSSQSGSTSMLQRRFNLGYNRAGRIMDQLEGVGIVGASVGGKPRDVIVKTEAELDDIIRNFGPQ
jgi:DNA segregation ATPase FtsK/SpoIIIE, S-DNA-T family